MRDLHIRMPPKLAAWLEECAKEGGRTLNGHILYLLGRLYEVNAVDIDDSETNPLTATDLADALDCFWNAAIGESHRQQEGIAVAAIMSEGIQAVANRLREIDNAKG